MNKSSRASLLISSVHFCGALGMVCFSANAFAQSAGAFATSPYVPFSPAVRPAPAQPAPAQPTSPPTADKEAGEGCRCLDPKPAAAAVRTSKQATATMSAGSPALPIVMFKGTPAAPLARPAFVSVAPVQIALPPPAVAAPAAQVTTPAQTNVQVASAPAPKVKREKPPGPFKRIWRDTKKSVIKDMPEALADALPWVDRGQKDEPIEAVLARVATDLNRASAQDPEWINPAESELRELSKRIATLAEPAGEAAQTADATHLEPPAETGRPFRPRPIWPGASGRPETQSRPIAVVTGGVLQAGPVAAGEKLPPPTDWVEEVEKPAKPPSRPVVAKRAKRPSR